MFLLLYHHQAVLKFLTISVPVVRFGNALETFLTSSIPTLIGSDQKEEM